MGEFRKNFGRIRKIMDIPNLIDIQTDSYRKFLQQDVELDKRGNYGLQGAFNSVFPISDFSGKCSLNFVSYRIGGVRYDMQECVQKGMTYAAPLKIVVRLVVFDTDRNTEPKPIRDIKEQEIYFGEIPLMTDNGTFIVNGTERVIVSQLHRSPGIFFDHDKGKTLASGKLIYSARVIPIRGSWLDLEFDSKDLLYVRIDRRRKMPVTILLKAMGSSTEFILNYFYNIEQVLLEEGQTYMAVNDSLIGEKAPLDIVTKSGEVIIKKGRKISKPLLKRMLDGEIRKIPASDEDLLGKILSADVLDPQTGEILVKCNEELTADGLQLLREKEISSFSFIHIDEDRENASIRDTLLMDKIESAEEAIIEIYRRLRPSNPPTPETAHKFFNSLFFESDSYDLSDVGRAKMNYKLRLDVPTSVTVLRNEDILSAVKYLIELKNGSPDCSVDDIDHLGNRRVRSVGELIENQYRIGLVRMERAIKEKMSLQDIETMMPHDLINAKPVSAVVNEFFGSSQLSQFMDQTNPLSEITHKRRLSALGPGGLTRERAGFEVRDVHPTHYGRICPVETPEGPNIGLIVSLSTFARVNAFGFIETPYRVVENGRVLDEIRYLTAIEEENKIIAQADRPLDKDGRFVGQLISARKGGDFLAVLPTDVNMMDVSPNQLVSVAATLIPFLEHDDANRALMGSNMQRQAVPLMEPEVPLVGTGMESIVARDSGAVAVARRPGVVESVDAARIVIKSDTQEREGTDTGVDIYNLIKYQRSNQDTCFNQKPIVARGQKVVKGEIIADGPATDKGELALGRNVMVAFMSWGGYNYEDSILVSERIVKDDIYTSIHIEEFETMARDTKLGKEEITRDIPNLGEEALRNLDDSGIVRMGVAVKPGDILVGKISPKGEGDLTPEERLLRAIFGEKSKDVKDTSLYLPHGEHGKVVDIKIFSREQGDKLSAGVIQQIQVSVAQLRKISVGDKLAGRHGNKGVISKIAAIEDMPYLPDGSAVDIILNPLGVASRMNIGQILEAHLGWAASKLGYKAASPALDGVSEKDIKAELKKAGLPEDGKIGLINGKTGEHFDEKTMVGYMYVMKLNHLVEDKIHMRSIGPYSLITQQPLGGKAQFGGQRFGEMEVWALEGYGSAYMLQEMMTIKSDDQLGRSKAYESIIKGERIKSPNVPASFNVLVNELKGLCLNIEVVGERTDSDKADKEEGKKDN